MKKITDDAASRVEKVMKKSEEQAIMIESLHRSVCRTYSCFEEQKSYCDKNLILLIVACDMNSMRANWHSIYV